MNGGGARREGREADGTAKGHRQSKGWSHLMNDMRALCCASVIPLTMLDPGRKTPIDYATLAEHLSALAYPARLQLLGMLRVPHLLSEIRLAPQRILPGENPDRPAAKPTVQAHLDKLVEAELVRVEDVGTGGRKVFRYSANATKIYALVEDLRRLNVMYAGRTEDADATGTLASAEPAPRLSGPRLMLVHGVYEGKAFPLEAPTAQEGRWVIGRRRGLPVSLDYDGFVSTEHAAVRAEGDAFIIEDLGSKNGTFVNWTPLARGRAHALQPADVVGVGRSSLVFARA